MCFNKKMISYCIILETNKYIYTNGYLRGCCRPWYDARAIARARAITRGNKEKGGLGRR